MKTLRAASFALALTTASAAIAQDTRSMPQAVPIVDTIPPARDVAWPGGPITLDIDATDITRKVFRVTETIPVAPGTADLVLLLPEFLPGNHRAAGTISLLADIHFQANGQEIAWRRDPVNVFAFHLALPAGTSTVTARFLHTSPVQGNEGRIVMTPEMLNLQWEKMSLYPAGHYVRRIPIKPTVTFPAGWQVFTALDGQSAPSGRVTWDQTDYELLVDSPVFAGQHAVSYDLGRDVTMNAIADAPRYLEITPAHVGTYRKLVDEAHTLFGAEHFDHYDFLLALTDRMGGIGLEHHRSSENQYEPTAWRDWDKMDWDHNVIPHEYVHSWNGKFRRPAQLWTPDYRVPMQDNLLWVYEGQTQFWGIVLAARSGVQAKETVLGQLATIAGLYTEGQPGRQWRSVEDTTFDPVINARRPIPYPSLTRAEDYYNEGALVWLEADQIIRDGTNGRRGLDDFAKRFFGIRPGDYGQVTYTIENVAADLDAVFPYDWAAFLQDRFYQPARPAPLRGIERAGYRLVFKDEPNPYEAGRMANAKYQSLTYSLGMNLASDGRVTATLWDGPAFKAGIVDGMQIVAVNGQAYDADTIKGAITAAMGTAETPGAPIELLVKQGDTYRTVAIPYTGGLRFPWLEPAASGRQPLDRLLAARTGG